MLAWEQFLLSLDEEFGKETINQWVRPLKILTFDARNLYLEMTNPLQAAWFEEHVRPHLKTSFLNNNQVPIRVHLSEPNKEKKNSKEEPSFNIFPDRLDSEFTFENWIVSSQNNLAFKLLQEIENPPFNPIYLFGSKQTGKTHLLTAAAHLLQKKGKKVFFVKTDTFTSHVVQAIRLGFMPKFRSIYREIDVLIIDDIEKLASKNATQEEFFHTFNTLHMAGKSILIGSSTAPSKLTDIEPRLMSRFEWGISLQIEAPPPLAILEKKKELWKLPYSSEIIHWIADTFSKDPLLALQALSIRAKGILSSKEKAQELLKDLIAREEENTLSPSTIIEKTAKQNGILSEDILGKSHAREYAYPRQMAMFLCRSKLNLPYQKIGEIFGRDHSTVISSIRQIQKQLEEKKEPTTSDYQIIEASL